MSNFKPDFMDNNQSFGIYLTLAKDKEKLLDYVLSLAMCSNTGRNSNSLLINTTDDVHVRSVYYLFYTNK